MTAEPPVEKIERLEIEVLADCLAGPMSREQAMEAIDELERRMMKKARQNGSTLPFPIYHRFTPGLYARQIHMPAGALLTGKIHAVTHPFVILKGKAAVWAYEHGWVLYEAPYSGQTDGGTRRVLHIHEDTIWETFHATNKTTVDEVEAEIFIERNHLGLPNNHGEVNILRP